MKIAYKLPGSEIVYVVTTASIEIVRRTLGEQLSQDEYEQHIREHLAEVVPTDALSMIMLPEDWVQPDRADRAFWRLRNGAVVVEKPGA